VGLALIPWILRVTNPNVAGNFLILMVFGLIGSLTYSIGGFTAPLLIWYSVIPALAAVVTESRWSLLWGVVVVVDLLGLYAMELLGLSPPRLDSSDLDILSCVSIIGFMAVLYTLTQLYEDFEYQALRRLRRTNRELARARDRALEASKAKTSFLANMSHELRTPLNAIIGYSELLLEEISPEEQHLERDLKRILVSGTHLAELVNGLLDLSKAESGKIEPELIQFHLSACSMRSRGRSGPAPTQQECLPTQGRNQPADPPHRWPEAQAVPAQPFEQRHQVHTRGHHYPEGHNAQGGLDSIRRHRHRHRHDQRSAEPRLPTIRPGGSDHRTQIWRHRPGSYDLREVLSDHGRRPLGDQPAGQRLHLHDRNPHRPLARLPAQKVLQRQLLVATPRGDRHPMNGIGIRRRPTRPQSRLWARPGATGSGKRWGRRNRSGHSISDSLGVTSPGK